MSTATGDRHATIHIAERVDATNLRALAADAQPGGLTLPSLSANSVLVHPYRINYSA